MTLTKADISESLSNKLSISVTLAKELVEAFYEEICISLQNGDLVKLAGFGNFSVRDKAERPGLNPLTKEKVTVSARRVVTFKAGQKLKASLQENL